LNRANLCRKLIRCKLLSILITGILLWCPFILFASENLLDKGIEEYKAENYEEAIDTLLTVRYQQPTSSIAAFYLGITFKQIKDYRQAEIHLRDAVKLTPPVKDAYLELAEVLYTTDNLSEARNWIAKTEQEGIKPAYTSFLKGLIFLKEGSTNEAIDAFNKAKALDTSLSQSADFQIALAQIKKQRFDDAKKSLQTLQTIDPTSDLASFAKEYEKSLSRSLVMYKPWQFRAGVAYQYDDNVILKPSSGIAGVDVSGEKDSSIVGTFNVFYRPLLSEPYFLTCMYDLYTNTYFNLNTYNIFSQTLSVTPGVNIKNGSLSFPVSYAYILVHERGYMGLFTARPTVQIAIQPEHIAQFSIGYDKRDLFDSPIDDDENRDGGIFNLSAGYIHPYKEGKGIFSLLYEYSNDDTEGKNWANVGNRFSLSLLIPELTRRINLILSGDIFLQDYKNTNTVFDKDREDKTYTASATVLLQILQGLNLNLQYTYVRADSNIAVYDYDRNIYTAGFEYRF